MGKSSTNYYVVYNGSHEFKVNHEEWIHSVKLLSGNQTSQQVKKALETGVEHVAEAMKLRNEARIAMNELLLVIICLLRFYLIQGSLGLVECLLSGLASCLKLDILCM
jgi:hypothetical protein